MMAVYDEIADLVYLFDEPDAQERMDEWNETGEEVYDEVIPRRGVIDFSYDDLETWLAA